MSAVPVGAPVTLKVTGVPSMSYALDWDPTGSLRSSAIDCLSQAGVPAESIAVQLTLGILGVERGFSATIITRATPSFSSTETIAAAVKAGMENASGNPVTISIQKVGSAGAVVDPDSGAGSWFDRLIAWLEEFGGGIGTALKWIAGLAIAGLVFWILIETGAIDKARAAFA